MIFNILTKLEKGFIRIDAIVDQETGEVVTLKELLTHTGVIYVSNLNRAFFELITMLKKLKYTNVYSVSKKNQFSFFYKNGECYSIKINTSGKYLTIANFEKKFMQDFSDFETNKKLIEYAIQQERMASSLGRDSFNEWMRSIFKVQGRTLNINACYTVFRRDYPVIKDSILDTAKEFVSGYQYAKQGYYYNINNYDMCSSYPAQLLNDTPKGKPIDYKTLEDVPPTYFYVVKFTALDIKLKPNKIDFLETDGKNISTFVLTKQLFELFKNNYAYSMLKIKRITGFKTRKNVFTHFVEKNVLQGKELEFDPFIKKYNKAIANSIVGYFGKNPIRTETKFKNGRIIERIVESEPIYLPIYLYVLGKAKAEFIQVLQRCAKYDIIYANTDGFLTSKPVDMKMLNFGRGTHIGYFKNKVGFSEIYIDCVNGYSAVTVDGEIDNTISGIRTLSPLSVEEYKNKKFKYLIQEVTPQGLTENIISLE